MQDREHQIRYWLKTLETAKILFKEKGYHTLFLEELEELALEKLEDSVRERLIKRGLVK